MIAATVRHRFPSAVLPMWIDTGSGRLLSTLREQLKLVPDDPYLAFNSDPFSSEKITDSSLPDTAGAVERIRSAAKGRDLVGVLATGEIVRAFANSLGQRNWSSASTFNLDWSLYLQTDKAVKNGYAGLSWNDDAFGRKIQWSIEQAEVLKRPPITVDPSGYRTYLAPAAVEEIMSLLAYSAFGLAAHRTKRTPLLKLMSGQAALSDQITIAEATAGGVAPDFQSQGFRRPDSVTLIDHGAHVGHLVSPRSAREYDVPTNGAESSEMPESLSLEPGSLCSEAVLDALGTGLYVGNLWYLNYSDPSACRTTGMTRFATFWVEGGEIVAPVNVMRFDDTAYHLLGDRLVALTDEAEVRLDPMSYGARSTGSFHLPGALVEEMRFTL